MGKFPSATRDTIGLLRLKLYGHPRRESRPNMVHIPLVSSSNGNVYFLQFLERLEDRTGNYSAKVRPWLSLKI